MNTFRTVLSLVALLLLSCGAAQALDIKMTDGTVYTNIRLEKKSSLGIWVFHDAGHSFLDYLAMKEPDRTTFGYQEKSYKGAVAKMAAATQTTDAQAVTAEKASAARNLSSSSTGTASSSQVKCAAVTKKGTLCTRAAKEGSSYCWQHGQ